MSERITIAIGAGGARMFHSDTVMERLPVVVEEVRRLTHIEHEWSSREWTVDLARTGRRLFQHPLRGECVKWEHDHAAELLVMDGEADVVSIPFGEIPAEEYIRTPVFVVPNPKGVEDAD